MTVLCTVWASVRTFVAFYEIQKMKDVPVAQSLAVKFADKTKGAISTDYALDRSILSHDTTHRKDYPDSEAKLHLSRIGRKMKP